MRRFTIVVGMVLCIGLLAACGDDEDSVDSGSSEATSTESEASGAQVYFGWLLGTEDVAAVAIEIDPADEAGQQEVRAYLCDGRGEPEGKAIWFSGQIDAEATTEIGESATLTSAGGQEDLVLDFVSDGRVQGSFKDADGDRNQFAAYPAIDGAGIYEVTLDEDLHYTGISTDGNELDAQADESGVTTGTINTAEGEEVEFTVNSLALATPAALSERGLSTDYDEYLEHNQIPGEYVAVIAPGGSHWLGRSGNVRGGQSGLNIIGLDKKC